jgi:hypothetical protein
MDVADVTVKSDEALLPKSTAVAPAKSEPEISMVSPPPAVPLDGDSELTETGSDPPLDEPPSVPELPPALDAAGVAGSLAGARVATGPVAGEP